MFVPHIALSVIAECSPPFVNCARATRFAYDVATPAPAAAAVHNQAIAATTVAGVGCFSCCSLISFLSEPRGCLSCAPAPAAAAAAAHNHGIVATTVAAGARFAFLAVTHSFILPVSHGCLSVAPAADAAAAPYHGISAAVAAGAGCFPSCYP